MEHEYKIGLLYCIFGTPISLIIASFEILASKVFLSKEFQQIKIFKCVSLNAFIDGLFLIIGSLVPITQFFINNISNKPHSIEYFLAFTNHYVIVCFGTTLKTLSDFTSVFIALYRLTELSKFRSINNKLQIKWIFSFLLVLSMIATLPMYTWSRLVSKINGTSYELHDNIILLNGYNFTEITKAIRALINILTLFLVVAPNLYFIFLLKNQYVNRKRLIRLNEIHEMTNFRRQEVRLTSSRLLMRIKRQMRLSIFIGSMSLIFSVDMINLIVFQYYIYFKKVDIQEIKFTVIISHSFICIIHGFYFLCYFSFYSKFRKKFKKILFNF